MLHRLEGTGRFNPDSLRRRVRSYKFRVLRLKAFELAHKPVILGVRDLDIVENVVPVIVIPNLIAQRFEFLFEIRHRAGTG